MLVGLSGVIGSGKDTFFQFLHEYATSKTKRLPTRYAFADNLKEACLSIFGGSRDNYFGTQAQKLEEASYWKPILGEAYSSYRKIAQTFGTEVCRNNVHPHIWALSLMARIESKINTDLIVITDVRFDNEAEIIKKHGGIILEIVNLNNKNEKSDHISEAGVNPDLITMQVAAGSLEELKASAGTIYEYFCFASEPGDGSQVPV